MKIDLVVFDLDGTLISSHETIYKATLHALKDLNISPVMPEEKFYNMIGLHFEDIFREFGFAVPDFEQFINIYKSIYFDYIDSSVVYSGVEELLAKLKDRKTKISLLTTKGQDQAELILRHFSLIDKFDYVMGRRPGIAHKPSAEPLQKICLGLNIDIANTIIVGDSEMDIQCGKNAGSKTCAVTYGYRTKLELQKSSPDFLIDKIIDLEYIVNGKKNLFER
ncbi:MAG: HAD-IA family hydrolase [Ignavibacteriales bacterium]|nr:HAD-IA family hydrolase [Ignavibacteriales bacterium]